MLVSNSVHAGCGAIYLYYIQGHFGKGLRDVAPIIMLNGINNLLVQIFVVKHLARCLTVRGVILLGYFFGALNCAIISFVPNFNDLYVLAVTSGLGVIFAPAIQALYMNSAQPDEMGQVQGAVNSVLTVTGGLGPLIFSRLLAAFQDSSDLAHLGTSWHILAQGISKTQCATPPHPLTFQRSPLGFWRILVPVVPVVPVVPGSMRIALNQPIDTNHIHQLDPFGSVQGIATEEWIVCHTCWPLRRISFAAGLWPSWPYHKKLTTHWRCNWNVLPDLLLDDLLMISWWPPNAFQYALSQDFLSFEFVLRWDCVTFPKDPKVFFAVPVVFDMSGCAKAPYWIRTSPRMYRPNASRKVGRRQHHLISLAESLTLAQALETIGLMQIRSNKCCTSCKSLGAVSCSLLRIDRLVDCVFQPFVKLCQARDVISFILFYFDHRQYRSVPLVSSSWCNIS